MVVGRSSASFTRVFPRMVRMQGASRHLVRSAVLGVAVSALAGCATLPVSGPTGHDIERAARNTSAASSTELPFRIVEVTDAASLPPAPLVPSSNLPTFPPQPTDIIGPNDVLNVTIFEAGVSLFGRGPTGLASSSSVPTGAGAASISGEGTNTERLGGVRVDDKGFITLPFVGRLHASGHTTDELQAMIRRALRGLSQDPQVMVSIDQSITHSVVLAGEVNHPGRFVLPTTRQTLNQTIALAGGYKGEPKDVIARVERRGDSFEIRLSDLLDFPAHDIQVEPGDTITLISSPESFSSLGAPNRTEQIGFPRGRISVAEAVALAGGANPNAGDAAAVFIFRYVRGPQGQEVPAVYHLNMMRPGALILSQRFMMRDKDILYVGNAQANQPSKFVNLLSQLFIPIATVRNAVPTLP